MNIPPPDPAVIPLLEELARTPLVRLAERDPIEIFMLIAALQLALRHPGVPASNRKVALRFAAGVVDGVVVDQQQQRQHGQYDGDAGAGGGKAGEPEAGQGGQRRHR